MIPLFIGGTGRSGTTVLGRTLSLHPEIFTIPFESRFIVDPYGLRDLIYALSDEWDQYHGHVAVKNFMELMHELYPSKSRYLYKIAGWKLYTKFHISPPKYHITLDGKWKDEKFFNYKKVPFSVLISRKKFDNIMNNFMNKIILTKYNGYWQGYGTAISPRMYVTKHFEYEEILTLARDFVSQIWEEIARRYKANVVAEQTPTNLNHALFLRDLFPKMRFIHIYRDPRDVVSSYKRQSWGGNSAVEAVPIIKNTLLKWEQDKKELPEDSYIEISLEELVSNTKETLQRICDFIGVQFDARMLNMDLSKSHSGRWKKDLSEEEVKLVECELGWFMRAKGYLD